MRWTTQNKAHRRRRARKESSAIGLRGKRQPNLLGSTRKDDCSASAAIRPVGNAQATPARQHHSGPIHPMPLRGHTTSHFTGFTRLPLAYNRMQSSTATVAFMAAMAMLNLQLADYKEVKKFDPHEHSQQDKGLSLYFSLERAIGVGKSPKFWAVRSPTTLPAPSLDCEGIV